MYGLYIYVCVSIYMCVDVYTHIFVGGVFVCISWVCMYVCMYVMYTGGKSLSFSSAYGSSSHHRGSSSSSYYQAAVAASGGPRLNPVVGYFLERLDRQEIQREEKLRRARMEVLAAR